ncbi:hypothetical protein [Pseudorhodobacter ferrugineus]|uniref:hypothetical protein n=1 Tax=Pseudorhodobacter ferrugineus TaxID=77008 RepID=UPI0003B5201F|nr:hypothetical protein [Pseudorhodobacter ferrugineus]
MAATWRSRSVFWYGRSRDLHAARTLHALSNGVALAPDILASDILAPDILASVYATLAQGADLTRDQIGVAVFWVFPTIMLFP